MTDETKIKESQISDLGHVVKIQKDGIDIVSEAETINFSGIGSQVIITSGANTANVTISGGGGGSSSFTGLTDTPSSYVGYGGKYVSVNSAENALEFVAISGSGASIAAEVYHSADQGITTGTWTPLSFNSESFDTDNIHDTSTNNSRLTCKTEGIYLVIGAVTFEALGTNELRQIAFEVNGSNSYVKIAKQEVIAATDVKITLTGLFDFAVNDYIELNVWHNHGSDVDIKAYVNSPFFSMIRIDSRGDVPLALDSNALAYASVAQTGVANTTDTIVELDQEAWDAGGEWNTTTDEFVVNSTGYYQVNFAVRWDSWNTAAGRILTKVLVNSTDKILFEEYGQVGKFPSAGGAGMLYLEADDVVELEVYQDSGYSQDILAGQERTYLNIYRVA